MQDTVTERKKSREQVFLPLAALGELDRTQYYACHRPFVSLFFCHEIFTTTGDGNLVPNDGICDGMLIKARRAVR